MWQLPWKSIQNSSILNLWSREKAESSLSTCKQKCLPIEIESILFRQHKKISINLPDGASQFSKHREHKQDNLKTKQFTTGQGADPASLTVGSRKGWAVTLNYISCLENGAIQPWYFRLRYNRSALVEPDSICCILDKCFVSAFACSGRKVGQFTLRLEQLCIWTRRMCTFHGTESNTILTFDCPLRTFHKMLEAGQSCRSIAEVPVHPKCVRVCAGWLSSCVPKCEKHL